MPPETLAELIAAHKGAYSYGDLAQGSGIAASMWQRWGARTEISQSKRSIEMSSIKAIAKRLNVSERRVWLAVGATQGLDVSEAGETELSLALSGRPVADLDTGQVDLIVAIVDQFLAAQGRRKDAVGAPVRQLRAARKTTGSEKRGATAGRARPRTGRTK